jgi:parallel beta-helix repeat protein
VFGKQGSGDGKTFVKQVEAIMEDRFTGTIWNTKWWDHSNIVWINNDVQMLSPDGDYNFPTLDSKFRVSGKNITVAVDTTHSELDEFNAALMLYSDETNWAGMIRRNTGIYGVSMANGAWSSAGVNVPNLDYTLRLIKTDSTFLYQYYDATSTPQTLYTDVVPELAAKTYQIKMTVDKPLPGDTTRVEYHRLTQLDIDRKYFETDATPVDPDLLAMNMVHGTSQYYGVDYYVDGNKVRWDSSGLLPHTMLMMVIDYIELNEEDVANKEIQLTERPIDPENVTVEIIEGCPQNYGTDYVVSGNHLAWKGLALEELFSPGDKFRVMYTWDPWASEPLTNLLAWKDDLRVIYPCKIQSPDFVEARFDTFRLYDGVISGHQNREPVIYVDPDYGSDALDGRQLTPIKNLFVATAWSKPGGTVVLYDGTHNPTTVYRKDITIRGAEGARPFITTQNVWDTTGSGWEENCLYFYGCQGLVDNLQFGGGVYGILAENAPRFEVTRSEFFGLTKGVSFRDCDPLVARCHANESVGIGFDFTNCLNPYVYSCVVHDTVGVYLGNCEEARIIGNTIDNNTYAAVVFDSSSSGVVASNSLTYGGYGLFISDDSTNVRSYNNNYYAQSIMYSRQPDASSDDFGNLDSGANPLYWDRENRIYNLREESPNIGTGLMSADQYLIDYLGATRALRNDRGAYEYTDSTNVGDFYVSGNGDDNWGSGTVDNPVRTLDSAMLRADSTIRIDGGHYDLYYLKLKSENVELNQLYVYTQPIPYFMQYYTVTPEDAANGFMVLPGFATEEDAPRIILNIIEGPAQEYGTDYIISYGSLMWKGYALDGLIGAGDVFRITFEGSLLKKALNTLVFHGNYSNYEQEKAIFISPSGSDSTVMGGDGTNTGGNGTLSLPYRTVTMALQNSAPGDNIVALAGEYPMFNGLDNRIIVPASDRTSVPDKRPWQYYEDLFNPLDFRAYGHTEYDLTHWYRYYAGDSMVQLGGGFLSLTYDGTNAASLVSSFTIENDFTVMADMRNAMDPLKFTVYSPDNTVYFNMDSSRYTTGASTGGQNFYCWGDIHHDTTNLVSPLITEYVSVTGNHLAMGYIPLSYVPEPADCSNVALNVVGGVSQNYGEDFYVEDAKLKWDNMSLEDELEPGDVLRIIYMDRKLSDPIRVSLSLKGSRFTVRIADPLWRTVLQRDMIGSFVGDWRVSFSMDTPSPESHHCVFGKGYVSRFLAVANSIANDGMQIDKSYGVKTERKNLVFYKDRFNQV